MIVIFSTEKLNAHCALINGLLAKSKVCKFDMAMRVQQDILRFKIPVDDSLKIVSQNKNKNH
jgi:hypothetical protein